MGRRVMMMVVAGAAVMLPLAAQAQYYPVLPYGPTVTTIVPPSYSTGPGAAMPFPSPQAGQQRLLELLQNGGVDRPERGSEPSRGCIYAGQLYSEGAVIKSDAGRQMCSKPAGADQDGRGESLLAWRLVPGG